MRISDWSSDVCSSDLGHGGRGRGRGRGAAAGAAPDGHYAPAQRGPAFARGHARDRAPGKKAALAVTGGAAVPGGTAAGKRRPHQRKIIPTGGECPLHKKPGFLVAVLICHLWLL